MVKKSNGLLGFAIVNLVIQIKNVVGDAQAIIVDFSFYPILGEKIRKCVEADGRNKISYDTKAGHVVHEIVRAWKRNRL